MAITQAMCTSFKKALLDGEMDFSSDTTQTFRIALYTSSADLDADTTAYTATGEVADGGEYSATGKPLTISTNPTTADGKAYLSFSDVTWAAATITARGALIYKSGGGNPAVAVLNFTEDKTSTAGDFTIQFPSPVSSSNAIIRIE